ncbi:mechanosensitive ion channel family protein [Oleiagrimonas soli]|uniref:Mechanosensing system component YbdG n=1 Tax=Oleiagrimonas soli TaxID=1543381 RepID=A0A841KP69_9GAMM|nr:mechanosensitive ion channel domain-containing protein [Oleiagrimonas soli]MBB6184451.1 miniconductance mechanosensitive channel [Oleiagrimonas soli]
MEQIKDLLDSPFALTALYALGLVLLAWLTNIVTRRVLLRLVRAVTHRTAWRWDDAMLDAGVFKRLAQIVPMLVIQFGIKLVPNVPDSWDIGIQRLAMAMTIVYSFLALSAVFNALESLYQETPHARMRSIKGYVQLVKIMLFVVGAIVIIATLINRSPLLLLSGLGAISAVLLLVFKDTILSLVASVQIATNDMLRVGDWISMPQFNADGDVIDIALHTVKVQNWDKTITTIPTWRLISDSFQNWRGMQDAGARRIKRALYLDAGSTRFLDDEEKKHLRRFRLLKDYLQKKHDELAEWNAALGDPGKVPVNQRRLTNLGTFRAYALAYLQAHPRINHDLTCMVRVLDPTPAGIPVEVYCFTDTTVWVEYEGIQGDIFDHLMAILPEFGLALFQQPSGRDMRIGFGRMGEGVVSGAADARLDSGARDAHNGGQSNT